MPKPFKRWLRSPIAIARSPLEASSARSPRKYEDKRMPRAARIHKLRKRDRQRAGSSRLEGGRSSSSLMEGERVEIEGKAPDAL